METHGRESEVIIAYQPFVVVSFFFSIGKTMVFFLSFQNRFLDKVLFLYQDKLLGPRIRCLCN